MSGPEQFEMLAELAAALAKAQAAFPAIAKNREVVIRPREGASFAFRYADLEAVLSATRPALSANGLALVQPIVQRDGKSLLVTTLLHAEGGSLASELPLPPVDAGDPKRYGAVLTYLRRYAVCALLGVAADDDLEEDGAPVDDAAPRAQIKTPAPRREAPPPAAARREAPPAATGRIGSGEVAWLMRKVESLDMPETAMQAMWARFGVGSWAELTPEQFAAAKKELAQL